MIKYADVSWDRMIHAVEKVRDRLIRTARALDAAAIPYAVIEENAVAAWVSRIDEAAVRNTQDVDLLLRRTNLDAAKAALGAVGFIHRHSKGLEMFLDGPDAKARDAIHILFAGERVHPDDALPAPDVTESEPAPSFRLIGLAALVQMKLTAFRDKDRMHLRDMLDLGLIDPTWSDRFPPALAERLRHLIATPNG